MTTKRVLLEPAFILHSRIYRDTSLLVEVLTESYGRLTLIARGVRSMRSRLQGLLVPFLPLVVSFSGKGELYTLQQAEVDGVSIKLNGDLLLSGFYLNELLVKLLPRHEGCCEIYQAYKKTLNNLVCSQLPEVELRLFEKRLLVCLGYGLELDRTVCGKKILENRRYIFKFGVGISQVDYDCSNSFCGKSLLALHQGILATSAEVADAKRLLRGVIADLLGYKPLKSRELFCR